MYLCSAYAQNQLSAVQICPRKAGTGRLRVTQMDTGLFAFVLVKAGFRAPPG